MKQKFKNTKGITLVALIITIIVLLILAVVAITSISNSNIINNAKNAGTAYTEAEEKEKVTLAVHEAMLAGKGTISETTIAGGMNSQFPNGGWEKVSSDADTITVKIKTSQRQYKITLSTGAIELVTGGSEGGENPETKDPDVSLLEKYIFGEDGNGRPFYQIVNFEKDKFIPEETTINDADTSLQMIERTEDLYKSECITVYFLYNNKKYRFCIDTHGGIMDYKTSKSEGIKEFKLPNDEEKTGRKVQYLGKKWIILYDNNEIVELISEDVLVPSYTLGDVDSKSDRKTQITKVLKTYNDAIKNLNDMCKTAILNLADNKSTEELLNETTKKLEDININSVRCVGSNPKKTNEDVTDYYTSDDLEKWPIGDSVFDAGYFTQENNRPKNADYNAITDYERMLLLNIKSCSKNYWMASRYIDTTAPDIDFCIRQMTTSGKNYYNSFFNVRKDYTSVGSSSGCTFGLRPVISINSTRLKQSTDQEYDYIIE